jgi:hypothetical protein
MSVCSAPAAGEAAVRERYFVINRTVKTCELCLGAGTGFCSFGFGKVLCIDCAGKNRANAAVNRIINFRGYEPESIKNTWIADFFASMPLFSLVVVSGLEVFLASSKRTSATGIIGSTSSV